MYVFWIIKKTTEHYTNGKTTYMDSRIITLSKKKVAVHSMDTTTQYIRCMLMIINVIFRVKNIRKWIICITKFWNFNSTQMSVKLLYFVFGYIFKVNVDIFLRHRADAFFKDIKTWDITIPTWGLRVYKLGILYIFCYWTFIRSTNNRKENILIFKTTCQLLKFNTDKKQSIPNSCDCTNKYTPHIVVESLSTHT